MKKVLLTITMIIAVACVLIACTNKKDTNKNGVDRFDSPVENISYQALSSIKMMEAKNEFNTMKRLSQRNLSTEEEAVIEKAVIDKYLAMMNELLDTNGGMSSKVLTSDKPEYTNLIEITTKNLQGEVMTYSLYYNEIKTNVETDIDDDDDDDNDKDEVETSKIIQGIAIAGEVEYRLEGKIEEEQETGETESEAYFKLIQDENNYVIVTEEFEQEENEYEHEYRYEITSNGVKVSSVTFELEQEDNELSIKLKEKSNERKVYEFKVEEVKGVKYIKIKVMEGNSVKHIRVRVIYDVATETYTYEYKYVENNK